MKKNVIAAVIGAVGLVGLTVSSYGQGQVAFNTYASTGYYPVTYSALAQSQLGVGLGAGPNVSVMLGYVFGTFDSSSTWTLLPATTQAVGTDSAPINGTGANVAGYIQGGAATIPGYAGGAISFEILAWVASGNGAGGGTYDTSKYNGVYQWTESSIAVSPSPAGFFQNLNGNAVLVPVPEPGTLALAGLGGFSMLMALRRKKA